MGAKLSEERCQEIAETFPLRPGEGLRVRAGSVVICAIEVGSPLPGPTDSRGELDRG